MRISTLCYLEKDGKYLMLHRVKKKNDINRDKWIGVGGGLEAGETPLDCVCREVWEETGYTLSTPSYRGILYFYPVPGEDEIIHVYTCSTFPARKRCATRVTSFGWTKKRSRICRPGRGTRCFCPCSPVTRLFLSCTCTTRGMN